MRADTEYDELFDWAPVPFLEMDSAGRVHRANQAACEIFGYSHTEFQNIDLSGLAPSVNVACQLTGIPSPKPFRFQFVAKTGLDVNANVHIVKIPERDNRTDLFRVAILVLNGPEASAAQEKEELKRLVGELDFYRVRWESILRQLPGGVLIVDTHGRVVLTNDWMQKLLKHPLPEYENGGPANAEMPGWRSADGSPYPVERWPPLRCLKTGEPVIAEEMIFDLDAHTQAHLEVSATPIKDRHKQLIAVGCVFFDVTAQRLSEKSFRASEARYRDIFEHDVATNFILSRRLDLLACNSATVSLFGYETKKDLFTSAAAGQFPSVVDRDAILERANHQFQVPERRYMRLHRRNGSPILVVGTIRAAHDDKDGKLTEIHCHFVDVTERRRAERKVNSLSGQLLHVQNEERRKLSHDLHDSTGQDLSALAMTIGLMEASIHAGPEKLAAYIAECKELVQACIRDIRTISYTLHPPLLNELGLQAALKWFIEGFSARSSIQVQLEVTEGVGRLGNLVEITLFRIVQQALSNVHRHSGSKTAVVRLLRDADHVTLVVADQGRGFSSSPDGKRGLGNGIGLASIRQQLSLIHGVLEILPHPGATLKATVPTKALQIF
jgi:PAS domain S-box-containing protein